MQNIEKEKARHSHSQLTARPTVPRPKIATIDPASTFAVFQTAPRPKGQKRFVLVTH